jgi:hypothetical protein
VASGIIAASPQNEGKLIKKKITIRFSAVQSIPLKLDKPKSDLANTYLVGVMKNPSPILYYTRGDGFDWHFIHFSPFCCSMSCQLWKMLVAI